MPSGFGTPKGKKDNILPHAHSGGKHHLLKVRSTHVFASLKSMCRLHLTFSKALL
jgi:hypothetical protein